MQKLLLKGSSLRVVSLVINVIIAFFMMPFVILHLGDELYGLWVIVGALIGYYGYLDFGLSSACQRFVARAINTSDGASVNEVVSTSFIIFLGLSVISILVTGLVILVAPFFIPSDSFLFIFQIVVAILGLKTAIMFPFMVFNGMITAYLRYDIAAYIELVKLILRTFLIVLFLNFEYSIIALALITLASEVLGYIAVAIYAKRIHRGLHISISNIKKELVPTLFNYSKFSFLVSLGDILRFKIDSLVIAHFLGLAFVTKYAIAIRLIDYIGQFLGACLGVFNPLFTKYDAQDNDVETREKFLLLTEVSIIITLAAISPVIIVGRGFIELWMGRDFSESYLPLAILGLAAIMAGTSRICIPVLYAKARHDYYAKVNLIEGVGNLLLSCILISKFGLIGVAAGTAVAAITTKIFFVPKFTCKLIGVSFLQYYSIVGRHLMLGLSFFASVSYFLPPDFQSSYINILLTVSLVTLGYLALAYLAVGDLLKSRVNFIISEAYLKFRRI